MTDATPKRLALLATGGTIASTMTEKGLALYPIIVSMSTWGNIWQNENRQFQELRYLHKSCGHVTQPKLTCDCCGQELHAKEMRPVYQ